MLHQRIARVEAALGGKPDQANQANLPRSPARSWRCAIVRRSISPTPRSRRRGQASWSISGSSLASRSRRRRHCLRWSPGPALAGEIVGGPANACRIAGTVRRPVPSPLPRRRRGTAFTVSRSSTLLASTACRARSPAQKKIVADKHRRAHRLPVDDHRRRFQSRIVGLDHLHHPVPRDALVERQAARHPHHDLALDADAT